jgi:hypothetical protein
MASINHASASLRVRSAENRSILSIGGVNPNMTAEDAVGFVMGIQTMYNRGAIKARIHTISDVEIED